MSVSRNRGECGFFSLEEVGFHLVEIIRRVDPDRFHGILSRKRANTRTTREPWNERQKVFLSGEAPLPSFPCKVRQEVQIRCTRQAKKTHITFSHLWHGITFTPM